MVEEDSGLLVDEAARAARAPLQLGEGEGDQQDDVERDAVALLAHWEAIAVRGGLEHRG